MTGNISNADLLGIFRANITEIVVALEEVAFAELTSTRLIVHGAIQEE